MTVFCWDGKYLAVDSRRTRKRTAEVFDDSLKIATDFKGIKIQDSSIRAVAQAGSTKTTRFMKAVLRQEKNFLTYLQKRWLKEKAGKIDSSDATPRLMEFKKGTLFIVTRKSCWHFQISPDEGVVFREIKRGESFAGGTGGKIGKFLMDVFGLPAQLAVCATTLHMGCCGGPVRYVRCRGLLPKSEAVVEVAQFENENALRRQVMQYMRRNCVRLARDLD